MPHRLRVWRAIRLAVLTLVLAFAVSCTSAYAAAIQRGDQYAQSGMWDQAAAEYERAVQLRPGDAEARIKLKQMRKKQSAERLARGRSLLQRGELEQALVVIREAVQLDPENAETQRALTDVVDRVLKKAESLLAEDKGIDALRLTTLVLKGSPEHMQAKMLDARVREHLAEKAYIRGAAFAKAGKKGNALLEFAACAMYRPGYRDSKLRIGQLKMDLRKELLFTVVLEPFADTSPKRDLSGALSAELLAQSLDDQLPLRVVPGPAAKPSRGVRFAGKFDRYRFAHDRKRITRSCDYVCGTDTKPNPEFARVEQAVGASEQTLARAEEELARHQKEVFRYQKEVEAAQKDVTRDQNDADRAREALDQCRARQKPGESSSSSCSSEESRLRSAQSRLESSRRRLDSPQSRLSSARDQLQRAQDSRDSARRDKDQATERMRSTPRTIEVERMCPHSYAVDVHTVQATVTVFLDAINLPDEAKLLTQEPFEHKILQRDETFEAQAGRCREVAQGDPLSLPSEAQAKRTLITKAIAGIRKKVMASYQRYRQRFLASARRQESAGNTEEAVESYVRYLLTGPKSIQAEDQKQIAAFLEKARGFGKLDVFRGL